jgi:tRNA threonylcarbamoyladenosine biosynthesis protein TsaB
MVLLAMDTSTPRVTVALAAAGGVLAEESDLGGLRHTEALMPLVHRVFAAAGHDLGEVSRIVVGVGPGPYTGLRVGLMTADVLAEVCQAQLDGVCSLDVIATEVVARALVDTSFVVTTDARRREVYWAGYDARGSRTAGPAVARATEVPLAGRGVAGTGPRLYPDVLAPVIDAVYPSAARMASGVLEGSIALRDTAPLYLREADARPARAPKPVTIGRGKG